MQFPDRESEHEAAALELMDGDGAVRLLEYDEGRRALLLERAEPGTPLKELEPDLALDVFVGLLPRSWKPAGPPFRPLADEAARWAATLVDDFERAGRPFERPLLDAALEAIETLGPSQGEQVLVNQDMHADNVVRARREPWLLIDPKPLAGEREFGIAADRSRVGARSQPRGRRPSAGPVDRRAAARPRAGAGMGDRADHRLGVRRR